MPETSDARRNRLKVPEGPENAAKSGAEEKMKLPGFFS